MMKGRGVFDTTKVLVVGKMPGWATDSCTMDLFAGQTRRRIGAVAESHRSGASRLETL